MTTEQRRLVHDSWLRAEACADELARCFLGRLFEIDPSAARLFASTDMPTQRAKFVHMLGAVVRAIGEPPELVAVAAALGRRHASYGASDRHYASVRDALLSALHATVGTAFTPAARVAWSEAYVLVASVMRRAAACAASGPAARPA